MKSLLVVIVLMLTSCNEKISTIFEESNAFGLSVSKSTNEVGLNLPISNLPLNSIYVEYPTLEGDSYVGNSPCESEPQLVGKWTYIKDYDGAFFRTESSNREFVESGMGFNLIENQSRQYHEHYHEHPHVHETVSETHTHPHEHKSHDHNVHLKTDNYAPKRDIGIASGYGEKNYMPGDGQIGSDEIIDLRIVGSITCEILDSDDDGMMSCVDNLVEKIYNFTINASDFIPSNQTYSGEKRVSEIDDIRPKNYTIRLWKKIDHDVSCTQMVPEYAENGTQKQDEDGQYLYQEMEFTIKDKSNNTYIIVNETNTYTEVE